MDSYMPHAVLAHSPQGWELPPALWELPPVGWELPPALWELPQSNHQ